MPIDCVDHLSQASVRLYVQDTSRVLAVDLSALNKQELEALRLLMLASPEVPILIVCNDDEPVLHLELLTQGAQDVLLKCNLSSDALRRALKELIAPAS